MDAERCHGAGLGSTHRDRHDAGAGCRAAGGVLGLEVLAADPAGDWPGSVLLGPDPERPARLAAASDLDPLADAERARSLAEAAGYAVYGADNVARFLTGILHNIPPGFAVKQTRVNGRPGLVGYFGDGSPQSVVTLEVAEGSIRAIRLVVNPEKLGNVPPLEREEDSR